MYQLMAGVVDLGCKCSHITHRTDISVLFRDALESVCDMSHVLLSMCRVKGFLQIHIFSTGKMCT